MVKIKKNGQVTIVMIMFAIVLLIVIMAIAPAIKQNTDNARSSSELNCSNSSISIFKKATCIASDMTMFYFIGGVIAIAGVIVGARVAFG